MKMLIYPPTIELFGGTPCKILSGDVVYILTISQGEHSKAFTISLPVKPLDYVNVEGITYVTCFPIPIIVEELPWQFTLDHLSYSLVPSMVP